MTGVPVLPRHSKGVGAVLKDDDVVAIADSFDGVNVGDLSAHVGDEAEFGVGVFDEFFLEVVDFHIVVVADCK